MKKVGGVHTNLTVDECGLLINPKWPTIRAYPDGLVSCECCGKGTLEIKCPYSNRGESIASAAFNDKTFCLNTASDGSLHLDHSHAYYYQVQTQLFVSDVNYCDYCVCTFAGGETGVFIERIQKDEEFWTQCVTKVDLFMRICVLPELLGKWYTKSNLSMVESTM